MKTMIVAGLEMNKMEEIMNKEKFFNEFKKKLQHFRCSGCLIHMHMIKYILNNK